MDKPEFCDAWLWRVAGSRYKTVGQRSQDLGPERQPSNHTCIGLGCETPGCVAHIKCTGSISGPLYEDRNGLKEDMVHARYSHITRIPPYNPHLASPQSCVCGTTRWIMKQDRSSSAAIALVWYYAPYSATARRPGVEMMSVNGAFCPWSGLGRQTAPNSKPLPITCWDHRPRHHQHSGRAQKHPTSCILIWSIRDRA